MRALIGHTGFVGGALARRYEFDCYYNSKNIHRLTGKFDDIVIAGMPGTKWKANANPDDDAAALASIVFQLGTLESKHITLISTLDVFDKPVGVTPETEPDATQAYGSHRATLEYVVRERFPNHSIIRLPSLFGLGLKKNALYDLMHRTSYVHSIHPDDTYQWVDVDSIILPHPVLNPQPGIRHLASKPLTMRDMAQIVFDIHLTATPDREPVCYNVPTGHQRCPLPALFKFVHETRRF